MFARNMAKKIKFLSPEFFITHISYYTAIIAHMWKPNFLNAKTLWSQWSQLNFKALML